MLAEMTEVRGSRQQSVYTCRGGKGQDWDWPPRGQANKRVIISRSRILVIMPDDNLPTADTRRPSVCSGLLGDW